MLSGIFVKRASKGGPAFFQTFGAACKEMFLAAFADFTLFRRQKTTIIRQTIPGMRVQVCCRAAKQRKYVSGYFHRKNGTLMKARIVGKQLHLHPVATLMSMFVGAKLFGAVGLFAFPIGLSLLGYLKQDMPKED